MDYEQKYNEALERAKNIRNSEMSAPNTRACCEEIFPELAESEDERIRKELVAFFEDDLRGDVWHDLETASILAWLEKQKDTNCLACDQHLKGYLAGRKATEEEKQKEQKPVMIQWTGKNLKEVIGFTGKSPKFGEWFKSWEDFENYVHSHDDILKLFCEDGSHYEVPVGAWITKTPDGYNIPSRFRFIQKPWKVGENAYFTPDKETPIAEKEQKPLSTEETELNSLAFLEQMGYTCIPPKKEHQNNSDAPNEGSWSGIISPSDKDKNLDDIAQDYVEAVKEYNPEPTWNLMQTAVCYGYHYREEEEQKPASTEDMPYITDEHFFEREPADSFKYKLAEYMTKNCRKEGSPDGYTYHISAETILKMAEEELIKRGELQKPVEWSEEDTEMYINVASSLRGYAWGLENEEHKRHILRGLDWLENRFMSLRSSGKSSDGIRGLCGHPDPAGVYTPNIEICPHSIKSKSYSMLKPMEGEKYLKSKSFKDE